MNNFTKRTQNLPQKVQDILLRFIETMVNKFDPLAVILVGSYAKGYFSDHSDLDIYIIVSEQDWRERGNTWINGIEIEYFINPVKQVRAYIKNEDRMQPHAADMLATGIVLYEKDKNNKIIQELIDFADSHLSKYPPLEGVELQLAKYSLDDLHKDLLDLKDQNDTFAYHHTALSIIKRSIRIFLRYHQTYQQRVKTLLSQLQEIDPTFAELIDNAIKTNLAVKELINVIQYVESLIGGKRPKEWKLRGSLDL